MAVIELYPRCIVKMVDSMMFFCDSERKSVIITLNPKNERVPL
jgi:hypothetical protein